MENRNNENMKIACMQVKSQHQWRKRRGDRYTEIRGTKIRILSGDELVIYDDMVGGNLGRLGGQDMSSYNADPFVGMNYESFSRAQRLKMKYLSKYFSKYLKVGEYDKEEVIKKIDNIMIPKIQDLICQLKSVKVQKGRYTVSSSRHVDPPPYEGEWEIYWLQNFPRTLEMCSCEFVLRTSRLIPYHACHFCGGISERDEQLLNITQKTNNFLNSVDYLVTKEGDLIVESEGKIYAKKIVTSRDINEFSNKMYNKSVAEVKMSLEKNFSYVPYLKKCPKLSHVMRFWSKIDWMDMPWSMISQDRFQLVIIPKMQDREIGFRIFESIRNQVSILPWNVDLEDYLDADMPIITNDALFFRDLENDNYNLMRLDMTGEVEDVFEECVKMIRKRSDRWWLDRSIEFGVFYQENGNLVEHVINYSHLVSNQNLQCAVCHRMKTELEVQDMSRYKMTKTRSCICLKCSQKMVDHNNQSLRWMGLLYYRRMYAMTEDKKWYLENNVYTSYLYEPFLFYNLMPLYGLGEYDSEELLDHNVSLRMVIASGASHYPERNVPVFDAIVANTFMYMEVLDYMGKIIDKTNDIGVTGELIVELMENDFIREILQSSFKHQNYPLSIMDGNLKVLERKSPGDIDNILKDRVKRWIRHQDMYDQAIINILGFESEQDPYWVGFIGM